MLKSNIYQPAYKVNRLGALQSRLLQGWFSPPVLAFRVRSTAQVFHEPEAIGLFKRQSGPKNENCKIVLPDIIKKKGGMSIIPSKFHGKFVPHIR